MSSPHLSTLRTQLVSRLVGIEWQSPIEEAMGLALCLADPDWPVAIVPSTDLEAFRRLGFCSPEPRYFEGVGSCRLVARVYGSWAFHRAPIGPYEVDFALVGFARIVVECDGHDFHERTKAQVRHDKRRDRYLQSHGWTVLRFAGSELHADPTACAQEVVWLADRAFSRGHAG